MRYGYDNILATGLFNTDCSKWRKIKPTEKPWDKFKAFFTTAAKDYSKNSTTVHQYSAASVQEMVDKRLQEYTFKAPPPPPQDENWNPNLPPQQHANTVTMESIQDMFKAFLST